MVDLGLKGAPGALTLGTRAQRPRASPRPWSKDEDAALTNAVATYGARNWKMIAQYVPSRNHVQCMQHWSKVLKPGTRRGVWSAAEDELLLSLLESATHPIRWTDISLKIAGRNSKQCRERWCNQLDPALRHGLFDCEEDEILIREHAIVGGHWAAIARKLPGRTQEAVKQRWKAIVKARNAGTTPPCHTSRKISPLCAPMVPVSTTDRRQQPLLKPPMPPTPSSRPADVAASIGSLKRKSQQHLSVERRKAFRGASFFGKHMSSPLLDVAARTVAEAAPAATPAAALGQPATAACVATMGLPAVAVAEGARSVLTSQNSTPAGMLAVEQQQLVILLQKQQQMMRDHQLSMQTLLQVSQQPMLVQMAPPMTPQRLSPLVPQLNMQPQQFAVQMQQPCLVAQQQPVAVRAGAEAVAHDAITALAQMQRKKTNMKMEQGKRTGAVL